MTTIGLLGDTHGARAWTRFALWAFARRGVSTVYQAGDFGIGRDMAGKRFIDQTNEWCEETGITLYVTPGNHEDWTWIDELVAEHGDTNWIPLAERVLMAPRGLRWEVDGVSFLSLGGAPSVDRAWRVKQDRRHPKAVNPLWHATETITLADVQKVIEAGHADVMIAHDAPSGIPTVDRHIHGNPGGFDYADILYAENGRRLMTQAFREVQPDFFVHGHYHIPGFDKILSGDDHYTQIVSLDCDHRNFSLGQFDTVTKSAALWDINSERTLYEFKLSQGKLLNSLKED